MSKSCWIELIKRFNLRSAHLFGGVNGRLAIGALLGLVGMAVGALPVFTATGTGVLAKATLATLIRRDLF